MARKEQVNPDMDLKREGATPSATQEEKESAKNATGRNFSNWKKGSKESRNRTRIKMVDEVSTDGRTGKKVADKFISGDLEKPVDGYDKKVRGYPNLIN